MKVEKLLPDVYYSQSRDFSYIGRLLEILFNYMKTGADCVSSKFNSLNIDATTAELMALTLGFESKHKYVTHDLVYVISSFSELIRKKGTKSAINTAIKLLMNSQKIKLSTFNDDDFIEILPGDNFMLYINIPYQLTDVVLLEDIFDYILPAGMLYKFTKVVSPETALSDINAESSDSYVHSTDEEMSAIYDEEGGFVYRLLTDDDAPSDWGTPEKYYEYKTSTNMFIEVAAGVVYETSTFYIKERNSDIGTILSGMVATI